MRELILLSLCLLVTTFSACTKDRKDGDGKISTQLSGDCALSRVTNGVQCRNEDGPVALVLLKGPADILIGICTGVFLTDTQVLTAAHCFEDLGGIITRVDIEAGGEKASSRNIRIHPQYDRPEGYLSPFDVALVETSGPLNVTTLPLLLSEPVSAGQTFHALGYGKDENGNSALLQPADDSLKKAEMRVLGLQSGFIVSAFDPTQQSSCSGDSGGPAIRVNKDNLPGIIGLVNGGTNDVCLAGTTAYFTNIQNGAIRDFITEHVPEVGAI